MNWRFWVRSHHKYSPLDACAAIEPLLSLYSDGMASPDEVPQIESHLAGCESCRQALRWMQMTNLVLSEHPAALPPADMRARIARAIAASSGAAPLRPVRRPLLLRPTVAAAMSLSVAAAVFLLVSHHPMPTAQAPQPKPNPPLVAVNPAPLHPVPAAPSPHGPQRVPNMSPRESSTRLALRKPATDTRLSVKPTPLQVAVLPKRSDRESQGETISASAKAVASARLRAPVAPPVIARPAVVATRGKANRSEGAGIERPQERVARAIPPAALQIEPPTAPSVPAATPPEAAPQHPATQVASVSTGDAHARPVDLMVDVRGQLSRLRNAGFTNPVGMDKKGGRAGSYPRMEDAFSSESAHPVGDIVHSRNF